MDHTHFYRLKQLREGVPLHIAERYLAKYLKGKTILFNIDAAVQICMHYAFPGHSKDPNFIEWDKAFQSAINILQAAAVKNPKTINEVFNLVASDLANYQSNIDLNYEKIQTIDKQKGDSRELFRIAAEFYRDLYEGYYRCVSSIFTLSKIVLNDLEIPPDLQVFVNQDPNNKTNTLNDDSGNPVPSLPELSAGCNRHLRNSIAHIRYSKRGRDKFYMWDEISGKKNWEVTHTVESLKNEVMVLIRTTQAMDLAMIVYAENKYRNKGGILTIPAGNYDDALVEKIVEGCAMDLQLYSEMGKYDKENDSRAITVLIPKNYTVPQTRKIMEGPPSYRQFEIPVSVIEKPVRTVLGGFIVKIAGVLQIYSSVFFEIEDETKGILGKFTLSKNDLEKVAEGKGEKLVHVLDQFKEHQMKLTITGPKKEV